MKIRGWVYVITNAAMPGLCKVGYSTKDPVLRARELDHTGSPLPYEVAFDALVEEPRDLEQRIHKRLESYNRGKEWFSCDIPTAIAALRVEAPAILLERSSVAVQAPPVAAPAKPHRQELPLCAAKFCMQRAPHTIGGRPFCDGHELDAKAAFQKSQKRQYSELEKSFLTKRAGAGGSDG